MKRDLVVLTIGHSTRTFEEFQEMLVAAKAKFVVDIRTVARSRRNPQFNPEELEPKLAAAGIGHCRIEALGGLRARSKSVPAETNGYWTNNSFHNYADHALTKTFREGLDELLELASRGPPAIMCAEAVWWRCHRRIVADYLLRENVRVLHIMGVGRTEEARPTPGAVFTAEHVVYPAPTDEPAGPRE